MAPAIFRVRCCVALILSTAILVSIDGCAKVEDDPLVWHEVKFNGTATILEVKKDTEAGTKITFYFTHDRDPPQTNTIPRLELSSFEGLPDDYEPSTGDRIQLSLVGKEQRKKSMGAPTAWGSNLRVKKLTCVEVVSRYRQKAIGTNNADANKEHTGEQSDKAHSNDVQIDKNNTQRAGKCPGDNEQLPQQLKSCSGP